MKKQIKLLALSLALTLCLCSCDISSLQSLFDEGFKSGTGTSEQTSSKSEAEHKSELQENTEISDLTEWADIVKKGHSDYGYNILEKNGESTEKAAAAQAAYTDILNAVLAYKTEIFTVDVSAEEISAVLLYLGHDYPLISFLGSNYTYQRLLSGKIKLVINYELTKEELSQRLFEIDKAAEEICQDIDTSLSDFDKAVICHDKLLNNVRYDLEAPNGSKAYGAFCDKAATCTGYAKAYQYLLCRLGVDSLIVYGKADEPHAWNGVRLDGKYYLADPTWNDRSNEDVNYISHEYMFLDSERMGKTHTIDLTGQNYPLPDFSNTGLSFFEEKGLVAESYTIEELTKTVHRSIDVALAENSTALQMAFSDKQVFDGALAALNNGTLDSIVRDACRERGYGEVVGRVSNPELFVLTYLKG